MVKFFCVKVFFLQVLDKYKWEDLEDCKEEETCPYLDSVTFMLLQSIVQAVQGMKFRKYALYAVLAFL